MNSPLINPVFGVGIHTIDFLYLATDITEEKYLGRTLEPGMYELCFHIRDFPFLPGVFSVRLGINAGVVSRKLFYQEGIFNFQVDAPDRHRDQSMQEGFIALAGEWSVAPLTSDVMAPPAALVS